MIQLKDVCKTYTSKSKQKVNALKGVNFDLASTGMTFILGKSGSGKSTLLNLLGGLDSPTGGEIIVDGVSMKNFKQADYDAYRNGYVGFVFQEFNLLADFNVKDNVALALQLSHDEKVEQKVIDALKQVELSEEYLTRKIGELSGGERQRVAIARSIVKDSKMILADEPTGNLDSATGESIWNILKKLSESKLVVVVSHDRESAEKYADRVIEIADGSVVADNGAQHESSAPSQTFSTQKKRLPFLTCLKMGANSLFKRKVKAVFTILLSVCSILAIILIQLCMSYSPEKTLAKYVQQQNLPFFSVGQGKQEEYKLLTSNTSYTKQKTYDYVANNSQYITVNTISGIVESKQEVLDFGLSFAGEALELEANSYYVTIDTFERFKGPYKDQRSYVIIDGEKEEIDLEKYTVEFLIGKQVYLNNLFEESDTVPILAGVIDCGDETVNRILPSMFARKDFENSITSGSVYLNGNELILKLGDNGFSERINVHTANGYLPYGSAIVTADGSLLKEETLEDRDALQKFHRSLANDELLISFEMFEKMFDANAQNYYVSDDLTQVRALPKELGQKFPMSIYDVETGDLVADLGEYKIAGIIFAPIREGYHYPDYSICCTRDTEQYIGQGIGARKSFLIKTDSVKNLFAFMTNFRKSCTGMVRNVGAIEYRAGDAFSQKDVAELAYDVEQDLFSITVILAIVCALLIVVQVLLVINLISFSITARKREIGILSALGASAGDISKIFLLETLIISAITFVATLALSFVSAALFTARFCAKLSVTIPLFRVNIVTVAVAAVSSFGLLLIAALIPLRKISKLKPIDAIRRG